MIHSKYRDIPSGEIYEIWKENHSELTPQEINILIGELYFRLKAYESKDPKWMNKRAPE